jgi:hypothetical protein
VHAIDLVARLPPLGKVNRYLLVVVRAAMGDTLKRLL